MRTNKLALPAFAVLLGIAPALRAEEAKAYKVTTHGSIQANTLFPESDTEINARDYKEKLLGNGYGNLGLFSEYVDAGMRFEYLQYPLPGFDTDPDFRGWGIGNIFVSGKYKGVELTAGDFYEQFGSGFILRTYEDRPLGIDNSIRGARVKVNSIKGIRLTALAGRQRRFWNWNDDNYVSGADAEVQIDDYLSSLSLLGISWTAGASYVLKGEDPEVSNVLVPGTAYKLNLPKHVSAFDLRSGFYKGDLSLSAEYAWKGSDPSAGNGYIYKPGTAAMLTVSYAGSNWNLLLQGKRSENMAFRSRRDTKDIYSYINNMPPFSYQHTYALAAMYPYGTQAATGEWGFQGALAWNFKRKTTLGGRYGTKAKLNVSCIRGLKTVGETPLFHGYTLGTDGPKTSLFGMGDLFYEDINLQVEKKLSPSMSLNLMYMYQKYNKTVVEGEGGMVNSNVFVIEPKFRISDKVTLRNEFQYLMSRDDRKDWLYGLAEVSLLPHLMFGVSDMWNVGSTGLHYYMATMTCNYGSNRLMLGYGRTRQGFDCSGGVCREVPAMRGLQLSYSYNF